MILLVVSRPFVVHLIHLCFVLFAISPMSRSMIFEFHGTLLPFTANFAKTTMLLLYSLMKVEVLRQPSFHNSLDIFFNSPTVLLIRLFRSSVFLSTKCFSTEFFNVYRTPSSLHFPFRITAKNSFFSNCFYYSEFFCHIIPWIIDFYPKNYLLIILHTE